MLIDRTLIPLLHTTITSPNDVKGARRQHLYLGYSSFCTKGRGRAASSIFIYPPHLHKRKYEYCWVGVLQRRETRPAALQMHPNNSLTESKMTVTDCDSCVLRLTRRIMRWECETEISPRAAVISRAPRFPRCEIFPPLNSGVCWDVKTPQ